MKLNGIFIIYIVQVIVFNVRLYYIYFEYSIMYFYVYHIIILKKIEIKNVWNSC